MNRTPFGRTRCALFVSTLLVRGWMGPTLVAQGPQRRQGVNDSATAASLKGGWQLMLYQGCRFAVPGSWHADPDGSSAAAPDGSTISIRMFKIKSWSLHKDQIKAAFGRVNVMHEDSERRLWFEIGVEPRIQHFIDISNGGSVCAALLEIRSANSTDAQDIAKRIVASIGGG
jgi:hypothetical protein